jgi:copper chaperone
MEQNMDSLTIKGMSCQHCVKSVTAALEKVEGVSQVSVDLEAAQATFENSGAKREDIKAAIKKIGFEPGE